MFNGLKEKFSGLPFSVKLILGAVSLVLVLFLGSYAVSKYQDFQDWRFDKKMEKIDAENLRLEEDIKVLNRELDELKKERLVLDAKVEIIAESITKDKVKIKQEEVKLEETLKELDKKAEENMKPVDNYTRCLRINEKVAIKLDCGAYK